MPDRVNRLASEKSPYLLQHARNPVDWYPWGAEAFERARREDRPVFLSIGYSTCHWCHVMERESFEDEATAALLNEVFVCVKVDREERPDIDAVYMTVCQMLTGSGGWPLTIVMTPEGKPFFAGTYFPRESRLGRPGVRELAGYISNLWRTSRARVLGAADEVAASVSAAFEAESYPPAREASAARIPAGAGGPEAPGPAAGSVDPTLLARAYGELEARFDEIHGGFGGAPKFPAPQNLLFLLRYWKRTGEGRALKMVDRTLRAMRRGGICDHVGFGYHRYATDERWHLPHFEKMLYDQATIAMAFTEAYQATGALEHRRAALEIFAYLLRDLALPEGAFASAEDADSEGVEGRFYLWRETELREALGAEDTELAGRLFGIEAGGNFVDQATGARTGESVLSLARPLDDIARETGLDIAELDRKLEGIRARLFEVRAGRPRPPRDDKILVDWNGLAIAALAKAGRAFGDPSLVAAAQRAADFILGSMRRGDGRLLRRCRAGEAAGLAQLDDFAFLVWGLVELYEASFGARWLEEALRLARECLTHFDAPDGGFFGSPDDGERLVARPRATHDGAIPAGGSILVLDLLRLARLAGEAPLEERAARAIAAIAPAAAQAPAAHTAFLCAADFAIGPASEVIVAGSLASPETRAFLGAIAERYLPSVTTTLRFEGAMRGFPAPAFSGAHPVPAGRTVAYVCRDFTCGPPATSVGELLRLLGEKE